MIKGGACLVALARRVHRDVVVLSGISAGLGVYRRRRGGRNNKYNVNISMTVRDKTSNGAKCALTQ